MNAEIQTLEPTEAQPADDLAAAWAALRDRIDATAQESAARIASLFSAEANRIKTAMRERLTELTQIEQQKSTRVSSLRDECRKVTDAIGRERDKLAALEIEWRILRWMAGRALAT